MPCFGVHESISGGHDKAVHAAADHGFGCVQIFSKNSSRWKAPPLSEEECRKFQQALADRKIIQPLIHDSYLINLGSGKEDLRQKSAAAFAEEIERAAMLGIPQIVMHPGSPTGDDSDRAEENGLKRIAASFDAVFGQIGTQAENAAADILVLLETTAGQGTNLGWRFEHLARIIELSANPHRFGVCIDTCHITAAGYSLQTEKDYDKTFAEFDRIIGLERLKAFHLNDSVKGCGSRIDRHAHIGHGTLGLEPFRLLVNDPRFAGLPMYLETPKGTDADNADWDIVNLRTLKDMLR
ncbi:MAG: deoxyribonuclease IV [Planctomycetaceae bacterium]|jgi:deoxyribonuclease-4|nr:deoxyribonuclease IV [Planctomycetaceae bacterium]